MVNSDVRKIAVSHDGAVSFWTDGMDVFRVSGDYGMDTYGLPMGRRWECYIAHWPRMLANYSTWITPIEYPGEDVAPVML